MSGEVVIRTYEDSDRRPLLELFPRAGAGSPSGDLWGDPASEAAVYLTPYMDLEPASLYLAVIDGRISGYLAGCRDSSAFPSEDERMALAIRRHRLYLRPRIVRFFVRALLDLTRSALLRRPTATTLQDPRWPAHLHINVAAEARGAGAGSALMRQWLDNLADAGVPGCYLQTLVENDGAMRFFQRNGFAVHGPVRDVPGVRYQGRPVHQQDMVCTIHPAS
jgi:GNAT superfamily N-acetyltransferase